jgi:hypothetical protein
MTHTVKVITVRLTFVNMALFEGRAEPLGVRLNLAKLQVKF